MERKKITIVGVGLIGGSLALRLKEKNIASELIGVEENEVHAQRAVELGLVDKIMNLEQAINESDVVILSIPADAMLKTLPKALDCINSQIVLEVGSAKEQLINIVRNHRKRGRLVSTHPMWGTEYSGPEAAVPDSFSNRAVIFCNINESDKDAVDWTFSMYKTIGMHILNMNAVDHDLHVAYISHISHITSFALANTVLEKEKEEDAIFELASAGFESTVRLAKSSPSMWVPILMQNRENVLDVLNEHIAQLRKFKSCLEKENESYLNELITNANKIRRIIK